MSLFLPYAQDTVEAVHFHHRYDKNALYCHTVVLDSIPTLQRITAYMRPTLVSTAAGMYPIASNRQLVPFSALLMINIYFELPLLLVELVSVFLFANTLRSPSSLEFCTTQVPVQQPLTTDAIDHCVQRTIALTSDPLPLLTPPYPCKSPPPPHCTISKTQLHSYSPLSVVARPTSLETRLKLLQDEII